MMNGEIILDRQIVTTNGGLLRLQAIAQAGYHAPTACMKEEFGKVCFQVRSRFFCAKNRSQIMIKDARKLVEKWTILEVDENWDKWLREQINLYKRYGV